MAEQVRSIYIYELHGHDRNGPLDYRSVFAEIATMEQRHRRFVLPTDGRVVAIAEVRMHPRAHRYSLRFVIGREGDPALFYDVETGAEREALARRNEMSAISAWLVVDAASRLVVQERRRPGVPLASAIDTLVSIANERGLAQNVSLSLHPRVESGFLEEVAALETIKAASIVLQQPNMSWTDNADSALADLAADSNMSQVEITGRAKPKQSLSKDSGLVAEILSMVSSAWHPLKSAKVLGRKPGDPKDSTVTTKQYAERRQVEIPSRAPRAVESSLILEAAHEYLDEHTVVDPPDNGTLPKM